MQLSHSPSEMSAVFDDPNLVSCGGLAPVVALAQQCGLAELVAAKVTLPTKGGVNGVVLGSVSIFGGSARKFSAEVLDILGLQTRLASSVLALRRSARTDVLTGLPNRDVLLDRLRLSIARLDRHAGLACVLYFDLDGFKGINDKFGHAAGDAVLHEFALRLRRAMRPTDTVARFGGDEFVAVCDDLKSTAEAELLTGRIVRALPVSGTSTGRRSTSMSASVVR